MYSHYWSATHRRTFNLNAWASINTKDPDINTILLCQIGLGNGIVVGVKITYEKGKRDYYFREVDKCDNYLIILTLQFIFIKYIIPQVIDN